jgi:endonuclease G, mitochondrial
MDILQTPYERFSLGGVAAAPAVGAPQIQAIIPNDVRLRQRLRHLVADGQHATLLEQEAILGGNDLLDMNFILRCRIAMECIGRIIFRGPGGGGRATGFLVAPGVLMTNWHVLKTTEHAIGGTVDFSYFRGVDGVETRPVRHMLAPSRLYLSNEELDVAIVGVDDGGGSIGARGFLRLIPDSAKAIGGESVTILQHPQGNPMQIALRENKILQDDPASPVIWYRADTAHGSSGAPVFNDSFQVVALHASGRISRNEAGRYVLAGGGTAETLDGLDESDVVWEANVGMRISRICQWLTQAAGAFPGLAELMRRAMSGGDVMSAAVAATDAGRPARDPTFTKEADMTRLAIDGGGSRLDIPLRLSISLALEGSIGAPAGPAPEIAPDKGGSSPDLETEGLRTPIIHDQLHKRKGFARRFLGGGVDSPTPELTVEGKAAAAPLRDGGGLELKYHKFSIWMHAERRMALYTASNVDWRKESRPKTADGKPTGRDALNGWPGKNYAERWVVDERIQLAHQLPDVFYSEDWIKTSAGKKKVGAFDKGHIVRRDDVCWGARFLDIQKGNGDTFHVTNCSPQIETFNQSKFSDENWGALEEEVKRQLRADAEKAQVYAGPVLAEDDRLFSGKDDVGPVRVRIPEEYWKIVVVRSNGAFKAYGFVLAQDVDAITETEFAVSREWRFAHKPIAEIEDKLRGWISLASLKAVDQFSP